MKIFYYDLVSKECQDKAIKLRILAIIGQFKVLCFHALTHLSSSNCQKPLNFCEGLKLDKFTDQKLHSSKLLSQVSTWLNMNNRYLNNNSYCNSPA